MVVSATLQHQRRKQRIQRIRNFSWHNFNIFFVNTKNHSYNLISFQFVCEVSLQIIPVNAWFSFCFLFEPVLRFLVVTQISRQNKNKTIKIDHVDLFKANLFFVAPQSAIWTRSIKRYKRWERKVIRSIICNVWFSSSLLSADGGAETSITFLGVGRHWLQYIFWESEIKSPLLFVLQGHALYQSKVFMEQGRVNDSLFSLSVG